MKLASRARFHSSMVVARKPFAGGPPALVTQMSALPNFWTTELTKSPTAAGSVTSNGSASTSAWYWLRIFSAAALRDSLLRAHMATRQPSAAKASAVARPIPWLDAATMATRFLSPVSIVDLYDRADYRERKIDCL